jgi:hypothetical protein
MLGGREEREYHSSTGLPAIYLVDARNSRMAPLDTTDSKSEVCALRCAVYLYSKAAQFRNYKDQCFLSNLRERIEEFWLKPTNRETEMRAAQPPSSAIATPGRLPWAWGFS